MEQGQAQDEDESLVKVSFKLNDTPPQEENPAGAGQAFLPPDGTNDEELGGATSGDTSGGTTTSTRGVMDGSVVYQWYAEDIEIANQLAVEKNTFLGMQTQTRVAQRTFMDNEADIVSYLNNKENWYLMASRMSLFTGCVLCYCGLISVIITSSFDAQNADMTTWEYWTYSGSVSKLYALGASGTTTSTNVLFDAFLSAGAILIIFSNFGFYLMPRWENHRTLSARRGMKGEIAHQSLKHCCICISNYRRIEATSNWVTGEEGLFKIMYNIVAGISLKLIASVPIRDDAEKGDLQQRTHTLIAPILAVTIIVCESYQLFRGERMYRRCTGKLQIMRLICLILGSLGMIGYLISMDYPSPSFGRGLCVVVEWIGFFFITSVLFLYCFEPIKAPQSVFALSGSHRKKKHRMQSHIRKSA